MISVLPALGRRLLLDKIQGFPDVKR